MRYLEVALSVLAVLLGLSVIVVAYLPRPQQLAAARPRPRVSPKQLGLAARFSARLIRSSYRPVDADFDWVANYMREMPNVDVMWVTPGVSWVVAGAEASQPLLEVERLLEGLERFSARVRSWRPGRGRERS